ncbi:DUF6082 family protein [Streptomyces sp. NPDC048442]|uniref:DUF6082 family protein n=1 Tax=Streptomyces sp. NPDC048442 TaxID=3154823 RepID=UPI0034289E42
MNHTRTTHLLLTAVVAVGAAHTALSSRDRRHQACLTAARHHLSLLADVGTYGSKLMDEKSEEEQRKLLDHNAWTSFWAAQFKAGILNRAHLRIQADRLLDSEDGRNYSTWARSSWAQAPNRHYLRQVEAVKARKLGQAA